MHNFNRGAIECGDYIILLIGFGADVVLRDGQPAINLDWQFALRRCQQYTQHHCRAIHVLMHAVHILCRLEVVAAGIKADALAHQRNVFFSAFG